MRNTEKGKIGWILIFLASLVTHAYALDGSAVTQGTGLSGGYRPSLCMDTDGGKIMDLKGVVTYQDKTETDVCQDGNDLT